MCNFYICYIYSLETDILGGHIFFWFGGCIFWFGGGIDVFPIVTIGTWMDNLLRPAYDSTQTSGRATPTSSTASV